MLDDGDILYKLPKQILQENQKSKVMSETDQLQPIMQAISKRNPVPSNEDGNRRVCTVCNKTFAHKWLLNTHLKGHYQAGKYNCSFCGCNFVNKNEFQQHEERHRDEREYVCGKCHKGFNMGSGLKLHLPGCRAKLLGEAVPKLPCPECGKLFLNQPSLHTHARSHIDKYECLPCGDITNRFTRRTSDISKLFWKVHQCGVFVPKIFLSSTVLPVRFEASRVFLELCWQKYFWVVQYCLSDFEASRVFRQLFVPKIFLSGTVLPVGFWSIMSVSPIIVPKIFLSGTVLPVGFWSIMSVSPIICA